MKYRGEKSRNCLSNTIFSTKKSCFRCGSCTVRFPVMFELGSEGRPWRALCLVWDGRSLQRCWEFRDARFISIKTWTESNKCAVNSVAMDAAFAYICMPLNFDDSANGMQTQEGLDLQGMSLHGYLFAALATCEFKSWFDWFQTLAQLGNFEAIVLSMGHGFPAAVLFINSKHRHAAKQHTYAYSFASFQGFKFKKKQFCCRATRSTDSLGASLAKSVWCWH